METQNKQSYKEFETVLNQMEFKIKLLDTEETETFKVTVTNLENKKTMSYKNFQNSIMEREISQILNDYKNTPSTFHQTMIHLKQKPLKMWGGYDRGIHSFKELDLKRRYYLFYGIVNDLSRYVNFSEETPTFKDFCDIFGYDEDSRKAEQIFKDCLEFESKIKSLWLTDKQKEYLALANQEEDQFKQDCLTLFGVSD